MLRIKRTLLLFIITTIIRFDGARCFEWPRFTIRLIYRIIAYCTNQMQCRRIAFRSTILNTCVLVFIEIKTTVGDFLSLWYDLSRLAKTNVITLHPVRHTVIFQTAFDIITLLYGGTYYTRFPSYSEDVMRKRFPLRHLITQKVSIIYEMLVETFFERNTFIFCFYKICTLSSRLSFFIFYFFIDINTTWKVYCVYVKDKKQYCP